MDREHNLARLSEPFDILVVGGGATGLGVAVDAAARGYRTALVEAADFAQGTSSRSTKLAHGGVRYLQQGNVRLVWEALHERGLLLRNAPHLVQPLRFLVPAYHWWERPFYGLGLAIYDLLAGALRLSRSDVVGAREAAAIVPNVNSSGLLGGIVYADAQFDDARLAVALARTAEAHGAVVTNYTPVRSLVKEDGRLIGAVVEDRESGSKRNVRARVIVNATGVFCDTLRRLADPEAQPIISASQGIHLVCERRFLPGDTALLVPHTEDGRVVFIIPWQGATLIGTTDTPVAGATDEPRPQPGEIDYLLRQAGPYLTLRPKRADVRSVFAGLRPLVKGSAATTAGLSRDHTLLTSPSGLVTIAGGKWTTYRLMAEQAVDEAARQAGLPPRPCPTRQLALAGAAAPAGQWREFGASQPEIDRYEGMYPWRLHPDLPYSAAMVAYAVENEMPVRLQDVLARRLRALILDARAALAVAPRVGELMADLLGKDAEWLRQELADFRALAAGYLPAPSKPDRSREPLIGA